jgi:hypothetical protein
MPTPDATASVAALPTVELHEQLIGAASPDAVQTSARRHPDSGGSISLAARAPSSVRILSGVQRS